MHPLLSLTDVKKAYGAHIILQIPQLTIQQGAWWIKGTNGSGKTTLMKIIAGINPFEGTIELNSIDLVKNPLAYRHQVSFAEAEPMFPGFITGWDLIRFVQHARNEKDESIRLLVAFFGIESFLNYTVGTYSSGMTKKLSLLLAFIGNPTLILLDEPLITLEDSFLPKLFSLIQERHANNISFLLSSHQPFPENQFCPHGKIVVEHQTVQFAKA